MRICPFIESFFCHAWSGNVNNGKNQELLTKKRGKWEVRPLVKWSLTAHWDEIHKKVSNINIESDTKKSLPLYYITRFFLNCNSYKKLTFGLKSRHIPISKMVRHDFLSYLRPEKSLKQLKYESLIFDMFCSFS